MEEDKYIKLDNIVAKIEKMDAARLNNFLNSTKKDEIYELLSSYDYEYGKTMSDFLLFSKKDSSYFRVWETVEKIEHEKLQDLEDGEIEIDYFSTYELFDYFKPRLKEFKEDYGNKFSNALKQIEDRIKELNDSMIRNEISELIFDLELTPEETTKLFKKYNYNLYDIFIDLKKRQYDFNEQQIFEICKGEYVYHPNDFQYCPPKKLIVEDLYSKMLVLHGNMILLRNNFYEDYDAAEDIEEEIKDLDADLEESRYIKIYKLIYN